MFAFRTQNDWLYRRIINVKSFRSEKLMRSGRIQKLFKSQLIFSYFASRDKAFSFEYRGENCAKNLCQEKFFNALKKILFVSIMKKLNDDGIITRQILKISNEWFLKIFCSYTVKLFKKILQKNSKSSKSKIPKNTSIKM